MIISKKGEYLSLKEAGERFGYSPEYLAFLLRTGRMKGRKVPKSSFWQTTVGEIIDYCQKKNREVKDVSSWNRFLNRKINLKKAAVISGYHPDYIGSLLRQGEIKGRKLYAQPSWRVLPQEIERYKTLKNKHFSEGDRTRISSLFNILQARLNGLGRERLLQPRLQQALVFTTLIFLVLYFGFGSDPLRFFQSFFEPTLARESKMINLYPGGYQGDWESPLAVFSQDLSQEASWEDFNTNNSASPLFFEEREGVVDETVTSTQDEAVATVGATSTETIPQTASSSLPATGITTTTETSSLEATTTEASTTEIPIPEEASSTEAVSEETTSPEATSTETETTISTSSLLLQSDIKATGTDAFLEATSSVEATSTETNPLEEEGEVSTSSQETALESTTTETTISEESLEKTSSSETGETTSGTTTQEEQSSFELSTSSLSFFWKRAEAFYQASFKKAWDFVFSPWSEIKNRVLGNQVRAEELDQTATSSEPLNEENNEDLHESTLTLSDFAVPEEPQEGKIINAQLRLSLAGRGQPGEKLVIDYFYLDSWKILSEFNLENEFSNALNQGYFLYGLPVFQEWKELEDLKIRFTYFSSQELSFPQETSLYLDAVWLEVSYEAPTPGEEKLETATSTEEVKEKEIQLEELFFSKEWEQKEIGGFGILEKNLEYDIPRDGRIIAEVDNPRAKRGVFRGRITSQEKGLVAVFDVAAGKLLDPSEDIPEPYLKEALNLISFSPEAEGRIEFDVKKEWGRVHIKTEYIPLSEDITEEHEDLTLRFEPVSLFIEEAQYLGRISFGPWEKGQKEFDFESLVGGKIIVDTVDSGEGGGAHVLYLDGEGVGLIETGQVKMKILLGKEILPGFHTLSIRHKDCIWEDNTGERAIEIYFRENK